MTTLQIMFCPDCRAEQAFERPCCGDGHGPDCVELCCVECGTAVVIGGLAAPSADHRRVLAVGAALPARHAA